MITVLIAQNEERAREIVAQMLAKTGNITIDIVKQGDTIKIVERESLKSLVSLEDKIIELEESLYDTKRGVLYKSILEAVERPLLEHMLKRTEGNQLKVARILGINRNTIRAKIKKLGIDPNRWKISL